jgi:hypothetical protein
MIAKTIQLILAFVRICCRLYLPMTGRLPNQQKISKLYYKLQQNDELKTVSGTPVRAHTKMTVHVKNIIYQSPSTVFSSR